ncbi:MAG: peptidoglycan DD-metalloendopeptidase family protein [Candidatus Dormibacteraeota bacterium]|nr:peptidoglycan DD-metalloendopeptidase family protein [Candidatus Dormibacteraeota bacterium]
MRLRFALAALVPLLLIVGASPASATAPGDLAAAQARAAVIESVRAQLGSQLATALQTSDRVAQALRDNASQQDALKASIADSDGKILALEDQISKLDVEIEQTNTRIRGEKAQIASLARAIYAQPSSVLLLVVESKSIGDMITRVNDLRSAGARAQTLKSQLKVDLAKIETDLKKQQTARDEQVKLKDQKVADLAKLLDLQAKQEKSQADLAQQIAATRYELGRVDYQSTALAQQIANLLQQQEEDIIAAAESSVWSQVQTINPTGLPTVTSAGHSTKFRFIWPMPTAVETQPFGPSSFWFEPPYGSYAHFHTGIDMSSPEGSPVLAADDGVVILAGGSVVNGVLVGYGNYVVVAHAGGMTTLYGHLLRIAVRAGDTVTQGQLVGLEGSTGNSTGAHLHFELRQGNAPINPAPFLPPGAPSDYRA